MNSDELLKNFVRRLIRMVRTDPLQIVITEELIKHGALSITQLAKLLGDECSKVHVGQLCQLLLQERILTMHRNDALGAVHDQSRPYGRKDAEDHAMWYIDYADVVNVVHFRLLEIEKNLRKGVTSIEDRNIFSCPRCGRAWTLLDVIPNGSLEGFRCGTCSEVLEDAKTTTADDDVAIRRAINSVSGMLALVEGHVAQPIDLVRKALEADLLFESPP